MREYVKIETLFKRDPATKKLIEGAFCNSAVEYLKDNDWEFSEKVDGTNIRIFWDGHSVSFGGRTDRADIPQPLLAVLENLFAGEVNAQLFEQKFGEHEVEFFGEGYGPKIQNGGSYRDDVSFILFDVIIGNNYQPRETVEDIAKYFNLDIVPILFRGPLSKGIEFVKTHPDSIIAKNGAKMEGLVARPAIEMQDRVGHRLIVKIKYCDFN